MKLPVIGYGSPAVRFIVSALVLASGMILATHRACAWQLGSGGAMWIWTPEHEAANVPAGPCFFRKTFQLANPEVGRIVITCDDAYELYVNGQRVGTGDDWRQLHVFDLKPFLTSGRNTIAVRAENFAAGAAGLVAFVSVRQKGNTDVSYSTDGTWLTSLTESSNWQSRHFDDSAWTRATVLGEFGRTAPWDDQVQLPGGGIAGRFRTQPNFAIERVADPEDSGSVVAMAFDEGGDIIASVEGGHLMRIHDANGDGAPEAVTTYCDKIKNCQGILPLNGQVFAVGDGPDGTSFCRISDSDADGVGDSIETLLKFKGGMGEHGPHAPVLGPDGLIYIIIGNHSGTEKEHAPTSPHHDYYEGDLIQPRYEDAGGHALGIKAPGGTIVRTDTKGSFVELYTGGFRNAYDMAFNDNGDLFTYDSDMEWDVGLPWYRPTRINHVIPGAEFGWRSGWAKWPPYFCDSLPATIDIGRGSPTGVVVYSHYRFPLRYQNALFACDWSMGRILAIKMQPAGGTYEARSEVFLQGRPLNATDVDVGPDGALYFSTGGRGTEGGIYRIRYTAAIPPRKRYTGVMEAIHQPQLQSAWGRDRVAVIKQANAEAWGPDVALVANDLNVPARDRVRALDVMQLVGPFPTKSQLLKLSTDREPLVRAKVTYLMGIHANQATADRLVALLDDADATVRRKACEALVRSGGSPPAVKLFAMLGDRDRYVAWSARRALEQLPVDEWMPLVLKAEGPRVFVNGAVGLLIKKPDHDTAMAVLAKSSALLKGFVNDEDFIGLMRVIQLALIAGDVAPEEVPELRAQLAEEYPSLESRMNRELVRILVYLQEPSVVPRFFEELVSTEVPIEDKLHLAFYARFQQAGWTSAQKIELLKFYERARSLTGGHSFARYIENVALDFAKTLSPQEQMAILPLGAQLPSAALAALGQLSEHPGDEILAQLIELDRDLAAVDSEAARQLSTGIAAVIGQSGDPKGMAYLRDVFERFPDRRPTLAMALAQSPDGENWPLLLQALPILDGVAAEEVLSKLETVSRKPDSPEPIRQVILVGLRLKDDGNGPATGLLEKWTGEEVAKSGDGSDAALAVWQNWFAKTYPDQPTATLPKEADNNKWTFQQVLEYLNSEAGTSGNPVHGREVFDTAKCIKCHRFGDRGEGIGPDLSTVSRRFHKREILEAIHFPSQVISDQYQSKTVVTKDGRTFTGIIGPQGEDTLVVLQPNTEKATVKKDDVEEIVPTKVSAMPDGLLNELTLKQIADLFAYMSNPPVTN